MTENKFLVLAFIVFFSYLFGFFVGRTYGVDPIISDLVNKPCSPKGSK